MGSRHWIWLCGGIIAAIAAAAAANRERPPANTPAAELQPRAADDDKAREADREAIRKSAQDFVKAFEKGDAKALAAFWTVDGEFENGRGTTLRGRAAIEKAFAEFFKDNPKQRIELVAESIRFPAADLAIEEGVLLQSSNGKELPTTTLYSTSHCREKGEWKIAVAREWGAGQDRLEDLGWLVGTWKAKAKDIEVTLSIDKVEKKPYLMAQFTRKEKDKNAEGGTIRIGVDAQRGQIRSWHFDDDGGHGQALWLRDGNSWVLDAIGVTGDGKETASVNLLSRLGPNELIWRSIDRVVGDQALPDTKPIKLTRSAEK